jgi:hypothetical protein
LFKTTDERIWDRLCSAKGKNTDVEGELRKCGTGM